MTRAPARCSGGRGFDSCRGLRFFFVPRSCHVEYFIFHFQHRLSIRVAYLNLQEKTIIRPLKLNEKKKKIPTDSKDHYFQRHVLISNSLIYMVLAAQQLRYCGNRQYGNTFSWRTLPTIQVPKGIGTNDLFRKNINTAPPHSRKSFGMDPPRSPS